MEKEEKETNSRFVLANFESRKHPRFSVDLPIEYWQIKSRKSIPGRMVDVSEGGLLLYLSEPLEVGQKFKLALFFGAALDLNFIEIPVQVVRKDIRSRKEGDYRVGVKFIDISPEEIDKLKNFLGSLIPPH